MAEPFEMSLLAVSKHISVLENAGLVTRGRDVQFRSCTLNAAPLKAVAQWGDQYRHIWDARVDTIDGLLKTLKDEKP